MNKFYDVLANLTELRDSSFFEKFSVFDNIDNFQDHHTEGSTYGEDIDHVSNNQSDIVSNNLNGEDISGAIAEVPTDAEATGLKNRIRMGLGQDNDIVVVIADALATSTSEAQANSENESIASTQAIANANAMAEAVGILNQHKIITRKGDDIVIGMATAEAQGSTIAFSQSNSESDNSSSAIANSESNVLINATAVGIDNQRVINTGKGNDIIAGVANTITRGDGDVTALTNSITALASEEDISAINQIEAAIAESNANATATSQTTTLGIINSGRILTGQGNDVIIGLVNNVSEIDVQTTAEAQSTANNIARGMAEAESVGIASGFAVGIVNSNHINTGKGNDTIIGFAINDASVNADAQANAEANAIDSSTQTDADAVADTFGAIAIGIDNASGLLMTAQGNDQIFGIGTIGITGGKFKLGKGNDRIIAYGSMVGIEEAIINLGQGDDLFRSAIVNTDQLSGGISFQDDQSGSIQNTSIVGGSGNDTFELGGFEKTVAIDGGQDHDVIKLTGNLDEYQIDLNSSDNQSLSINYGDSVLTVKNVESFHFGSHNQIYQFEDLA